MWDTKYRPLRFSDVLGQPGTVQLLKARLRHRTALDTSYIFSGFHGSGKTTLARIYARGMSCQDLREPDKDPEPCNECDNCRDVLNEEGRVYVEKDAASNGTIDHIRAIVEDLPFAVFGASKRIYTFDEAHRMSRDAQDVLLKPIEDKRLVAIFCTTEAEKIRGPIRSRCEEYAIRKITREDILARIKWVLGQEGVEHEDDAILSVIDYSGNHVRDVMNRVEMIAQMGKVSISNVREYLNLGVVSVYFDILLSLHDARRACEMVEKASERASPEEVASGIAEAAMNAYRLANGMAVEFTYVDRPLAEEVWKRYQLHVLRFAEHFLRNRYSTKAALLSDILILSQHPGNVPPTGAQPPVMFMVGGTPVAAPTQTQGAPPSVTGSLPVTAAPQQAVAPSSPVIPPAPPRDPRLRSDGIGPLGADPLALTPEDHMGVPLSFPRTKQRPATPAIKFPNSRGVDDPGLDPIHPEEWKREFERQWAGRTHGR